MITWFHDSMVIWLFDYSIIWLYDYMIIWLYDSVAPTPGVQGVQLNPQFWGGWVVRAMGAKSKTMKKVKVKGEIKGGDKSRAMSKQRAPRESFFGGGGGSDWHKGCLWTPSFKSNGRHWYDYMIIWFHGYMIIRLYDYMIIWSYDYTIIGFHDSMVIWFYDYMIIRLYDYTIPWLYERRHLFHQSTIRFYLTT